VSFGEDWLSEENIRKRVSLVTDLETWAWGNLAEIMKLMVADRQNPGPPYTHTLTGPRPVLARNGKPLYWHPVRPYTLTSAGEGQGSRPSAKISG